MKIALLVALALVGAAVASQWPEVQRYMKIRQM